MTSNEKYLKMLESLKVSERYEACEWLRVSPSLTKSELDALKKATHDPDPGVRDAAQRALNIHKGEGSSPLVPQMAPQFETDVPPTETNKPSRWIAYVTVAVGGILLFSGVITGFIYLGAPLLAGKSILGEQLGEMAGMFLGLVCGGLAVFHGLGSIFHRPSHALRLPPFFIFWIIFALVLGLGNLLLNTKVSTGFLFPFIFLLGAALPTSAVLAWVLRRLGWPVSWRQVSLALVCGATLSILVTFVLDALLPYLAYLLIGPLEFLAEGFSELGGGGSGLLERLFFSPAILVFLLYTAIAAPIPEEFAKALGVPLFGRARITSERQALAIGLACGAGFAILENMLYEGVYAGWSGWSWGGITLLRGIGSVLHPLASGLVALGWYRMREGGVGKLLKGYLGAVGLHTLWNGGFQPLVYLAGLDQYAGKGVTFSFYGDAINVLLVAYLVVLSLGLWWLLRRLVMGMAQGVTPDLAPERISARALAMLAFVMALVIVPIGAALNGAWGQFVALFLAGK